MPPGGGNPGFGEMRFACIDASGKEPFQSARRDVGPCFRRLQTSPCTSDTPDNRPCVNRQGEHLPTLRNAEPLEFLSIFEDLSLSEGRGLSIFRRVHLPRLVPLAQRDCGDGAAASQRALAPPCRPAAGAEPAPGCRRRLRVPCRLAMRGCVRVAGFLTSPSSPHHQSAPPGHHAELCGTPETEEVAFPHWETGVNSITFTPGGGSKRNVSSLGLTFVWMPSKRIVVSFPNRSTTVVSRTSPVAASATRRSRS